ncbi:MAG: AAA family ATPase [Lachnospiraceae bacterium]|nr:AAA family ATPase [Lachnospiraceae bacterium]
MIQDNNYKSKALRLYPAPEMLPQLSQNGVPRRVVHLKGKEADYMLGQGKSRPVMEQMMQLVREVEGNNLWPWLARIRNVFLVTDSLLDAQTAACLVGGLHGLAAMRCGTGEDEEEYEDYEYFEYEDVSETHAVPVYFNLSGTELKEGESANLPQFAAIAAAMEDMECILFDGLGDEKLLGKQLDLIRVCPAEVRMVVVPKKLAKAAEIKQLVELDPDHNYMIELDKTDFEYYVRVCRDLLADEGANFADETEMREALLRMMRCTGESFSEEWIGQYLDKGLDGQYFDLHKMFGSEESRTAMQRLQEMPGLQNYKTVIREQRALVREESRNPRLKMHRNMIFAGNPGSGKTTAAELAAEILADSGATRPVFVMPSRSDLIGKFVGQTAPKVADAFERARGGMLFVDEAGFFLNQKSGGYVDEAIKEFVRYMELYPDVTVIFAMYANEVADFLNLDEGLRSRVSRVVKFEDYSVQELVDIANYMFQESGYTLAGGEKAMREYFESERRKGGFGNARAARKLVESVILSVSLARDAGEETDSMPQDSMEISEPLMRQGISRMKRESQGGRGNMGFLPAASGGTAVKHGAVQAGFAD